jgi:sec-independent protein translocase protein TatA
VIHSNHQETKMGNLGWGEMLLIGVVVLLLFGARRLPEIGAALGKGIRDFKRSLSDTERAITDSGTSQADRLPRGEQAVPAGGTEQEVRSEPKRLL